MDRKTMVRRYVHKVGIDVNSTEIRVVRVISYGRKEIVPGQALDTRPEMQD